MGRFRREHALEEPPLRVQRVPDQETRGPASSADAPSPDPDGAEEFGLRVAWQSEAVKIEAAEFLVATRIQQAARIRAAQELEQRRRPRAGSGPTRT